MNCSESRLLLHAQADNELAVADSLKLEFHLQECPACAAERQGVNLLKAALRQPSLRYEAPNPLRKDIGRLARKQRSEPGQRLFQSLWFWKAIAFGATAITILAFLVLPGVPGRDELLDEAVSSHIRSLMAEHLTDVASSDQHTVKPWFNGKLDFAPNVKDFADQGFPLVGGRLDYLGDRTVAALVYRRNRHLINVFVWPTSAPGEGRSSVANWRGYSVITRSAGRLRYCLVSDLNPRELGELAGLLEQ